MLTSRIEHAADMLRSSTPRAIFRFALLPEWIALCVYLALVSVAIAHHEPWADEAQSWQLARTLSFRELFGTYLHYEGSPGLWHLLLWVLTRSHLSYTGLHWLCGGIAAIAVGMLLFAAPFPRPIKLLLPFTYFLAFQYAVIARSYVLFPPLIFFVAAVWRRYKGHTTRMALLLGTLANISLHVAVISSGFALLCARETWIEHRQRPSHAKSLWAQAFAIVLLLTLYGTAALTAKPPPDIWIASMSSSQSNSTVNPVGQINVSMAPVRRTGILPRNLAICVLQAISASGWGIVEPILFGIPFWMLMASRFYQRGTLIYLLPIFFFIMFSSVSYINFWHAGLLVPTLIALFWITWHDEHSELCERRWTGPCAQVRAISWIAIGYALVLQCAWTVHAVTYDWVQAYSPDLATSRFLEPYIKSGGRIAVTYYWNNGLGSFKSVGLCPYFHTAIFLNQHMPFWFWSTRNMVDEDFLAALNQHPGIVMLEYSDRLPYSPRFDEHSPTYALITHRGYKHTKTFCGAMPQQLSFGEYTCHLLFKLSPDR